MSHSILPKNRRAKQDPARPTAPQIVIISSNDPAHPATAAPGLLDRCEALLLLVQDAFAGTVHHGR